MIRREETLTRDPELDSGPPTMAAGESRPDRAAAPYAQRLVFNPFLGVLTFIATVELLVRWPKPGVTLAAVGFVGFGLAWALLHYHCLDCGKTGAFVFRNRHACRRVRRRWVAGNLGAGWHYPTAGEQLSLWIVALLIALFLTGTTRG